MFNQNNIEEVVCPWCESNKSTKWCNDLEPFLTVQCDSCKIVYVKRRLNEAGRISYYQNYNTEKHQEAHKSQLRDLMYQIENTFVTDFVKEGNILDVGCGGGFFLDTFDSKKFNKYGVEYGYDGFQTANKKYTDNIYLGDFSKLDCIKEKSFDLVIFRGVLEHVTNPKEYLDKAVKVLKDGGHIFITATPNLNSLCADLFRENFNQHIPEEHIILFGDDHLKKYLKKEHMNLVSERIFYLETPYADIHNDAEKILAALDLKKNNKPIKFKSPAWYGNMMTLLFKKENFDVK